MSNNNITYTLTEDGYYIPNLSIPEWKPVGKYGQLHLSHIKEHRRSFYSVLMITGKLNDHLVNIDTEAEQLYKILMREYTILYGITELLKENDQLAWVRKMNGIKAMAEELILNEIIYR